SPAALPPALRGDQPPPLRRRSRLSDGVPLPPPCHPPLRRRRLEHLSRGAGTRAAASRPRRGSDQEGHRIDKLTDLPPTTYHLPLRRRRPTPGGVGSRPGRCPPSRGGC